MLVHFMLTFLLRCFQPILFGSVFIRSFSFSIGFLRVRISVKLVSLYIKWSLCAGGGNVTFDRCI